MGKITVHIPNLLTLCNLSCGVAAIYFKDDINLAVMLIIAGAVFDVFDGAAARWLKVSSPIGKDLDSLADLVSFGLAPSLLYLHVYHHKAPWVVIPVVLVTAGSALRLAVFNHKEPDKDFAGLPTPANGLFFLGLMWAYENGSLPALGALVTPVIYYLFPIISFLLMNSSIRFFSLKSLSSRFTRIGLSVVVLTFIALLFTRPNEALWITMMVYVCYNVIGGWFSPKLLKN